MLTEESAARLLGTTTAGTSRGQMRFALHQLGIPFEERNDPRLTPAELPAPALLMVDHPAVGREGHMVMYAGRSEGGYEIWDPLTGRVEWSEREARSRWHGRAFSCPRE